MRKKVSGMTTTRQPTNVDPHERKHHDLHGIRRIRPKKSHGVLMNHLKYCDLTWCEDLARGFVDAPWNFGHTMVGLSPWKMTM